MNKILNGLYVGSKYDSQDRFELENKNITHIVSIIEDAKENPAFKNIKYFCIRAEDSPFQDLKQYFLDSIEFIHKARIENGNVLIHCLMGISRSVTIAIAYLMTCTELTFREALDCVRGVRKFANPNFGFQRQLQNYELIDLRTARYRLNKRIGKCPHDDEKQCKENIEIFWKQFDRIYQILMLGKMFSEDDIVPRMLLIIENSGIEIYIVMIKNQKSLVTFLANKINFLVSESVF